MIKVKKISKKYGNLHVLKNVDLEINTKEIVAITGPSGAGKTTLLNILGTLEVADYQPDRKLEIGGQDVFSLRGNELAKFRNQHLGFVFQSHQLLPEFSAIENVCIPAMIGKTPLMKAQKDAMELLDYLGLRDRAEHKPSMLSGGEQQRVAVARALINKPKLLLADEPTTALDVTIQAQVINLMKDIIKEFNMGVIFITHDLGVIAQVADDVAVMYLGSVVEQGPVNEILKNPMHPYTKGLINALPDINNLDAPLTPIPGNIPSPLDRPSGCVFRTRCPHASRDGKQGNIEMGLVEIKPGHWLDKCGVDCGKT